MQKTTRRPQPVKYTKTVSTYVPLDTYANIDAVCSERNINLATFVRELIDDYFQSVA